VSLLGNAALAMWWDIAPEVKGEFEDWHSHEHFPERMSVPGFRRGTRWTSVDGGPGIFVMYEVDAHETLSSAAYAARLNAPTPWSTKMMPHHRNMVRSQCHVVASGGAGTARYALTLRFAAESMGVVDVPAHLRTIVDGCATRPGIVGAHLLRHQPPAIAQTTEQRIRPAADQIADWILVVCGYDVTALDALEAGTFGDSSANRSVTSAHIKGLYSLSHSATAADVR